MWKNKETDPKQKWYLKRKLAKNDPRLFFPISDAIYQKGNPCDVVANALSCDIVESKFELQSRCWVHFRTNLLWKGMNTLILQLVVK